MVNPIKAVGNGLRVRKFNRELSKFDKDFSNYESLNIDLYNYYDAAQTKQFEKMNNRWFSGRSKLFERGYFDMSATDALAAGYTREEMIMHGKATEDAHAEPPHPWCKELGLSAKIAQRFEDPVRNFVNKHPGPFGLWQKFADIAI
jgi:hypothetical protein